ncbi:GntR family transcriptional regulator [Martelella mediterranea]|uniref:DNA-binding transcriptional repressor MngR n=1 Tax=Martelella mediterranea DSM 17316 TaxID=1122214 RepID=A0A1U9YVJ3_9HYPH|nr:GntR family transcriptional regulator [Martelella mediterranea]AQZ49463.1 DNA-binding transcriptional repressor MngR [Martelella mediterranea DSM 17316]
MTAEPATGRDRLIQIHDIIRERIMMLDYPPGEKLSEVALANEFGVSRTPLRRVLAGLEDEGLLRSVHGVGTIVTDVDFDELAQVYRLRMELVVLIAHLDPAPLTAETVADFRALHERALALRQTPAPRDFAALDRDMFLAINRLSLNQPLRETGERLYFRTARIWLQAITASDIDLENEADIYCRETKDILAAVEAGQLDALSHLRRAHIAMSFERMR